MGQAHGTIHQESRAIWPAMMQAPDHRCELAMFGRAAAGSAQNADDSTHLWSGPPFPTHKALLFSPSICAKSSKPPIDSTTEMDRSLSQEFTHARNLIFFVSVKA